MSCRLTVADATFDSIVHHSPFVVCYQTSGRFGTARDTWVNVDRDTWTGTPVDQRRRFVDLGDGQRVYTMRGES